MPKADLIAGVVLMIGGLALLFFIIPAQTEQDTGAAVPPDMLPQICALGITLLAAVLTLNALRGKTPDAKPPKASEWRAMVAVVVIILAGAALFQYIHPVVAGLFVTLATMLYMDERRWHLLLALPAALVVIVYLLFYEFLGTAIL